MDTRDPAVLALIALCERESGYKSVARRSGLSPNNLWQIINGTRLKSGEPRGIGPETRRKLSTAYPGWNASEPVAPEPARPFDTRALQDDFDQIPNSEKLRVFMQIARLVVEAKRPALPSAAPPASRTQDTPSDKTQLNT